MQEFILTYWPWLVAPAYIVLFVIACWGRSAVKQENERTHILNPEDKAACFVLAIPFSAIIIFIVIIYLLVCTVYYSAQVISKALYFILPR